MDLSLQAWGMALLAAWLVGASKTGLPGAVTIAVVLFASILPAREATGALLPVLVCADFIAVGMLRKNVRWPQLLRLFPWTAVGVGLGTVMLYFSNDLLVQRVIGVIVVGMMVYQLVRKALQQSDVHISQHPAFAPSMGVAAGFTTMVANAAGPFVLIYMLAMRMGKLEVVGTIAWYFLVVTYPTPATAWREGRGLRGLFGQPVQSSVCGGIGLDYDQLPLVQPLAGSGGGIWGDRRPLAASAYQPAFL